MLRFTKAQAYGNDFVYVRRDDVRSAALDDLARQMCNRHSGIGADGLIVYERDGNGARMRLYNADGGIAEVSGNGVRGLAALLMDEGKRQDSRRPIVIQTDGGAKRLEHIGTEGRRHTFRAWMGVPMDLRQESLAVGSGSVLAVVLNMGNPQCVLVGPLPDQESFARLGSALERHPRFPARTNVEFAEVEAPDRLRILIWERGVGPTSSSGTGSCAALVAAAAYGGASRDAEVIAPGGGQRVEWKDDGVYLTGWAEVVGDGVYERQIPLA
jgi:diaminopimelate epimerase